MPKKQSKKVIEEEVSDIISDEYESAQEQSLDEFGLPKG